LPVQQIFKFNLPLLTVWLYSRLITDSDSKKVLDAQTKLHNEKRFERLKQKYIKRPFRGTVVQEVYICYDQLQVDAFNECTLQLKNKFSDHAKKKKKLQGIERNS